MPKKKSKINWNIIFGVILILLVLSAIFFLFFGLNKGWFEVTKDNFIYIGNDSDDGTGGGSSGGGSSGLLGNCEDVCQQGVNNVVWDTGYNLLTAFNNDCLAGETKVYYGYQGEDPILTCCCYNEEEDQGGGGYSEGDILITESDDGTMGNGINDIMNPIDMSSIETGGDCHLGVKIDVWWDYVNESTCSGIQGFETMAFYFYDSNTGIALDVPRNTQKHFDYCPKYYDGVTDWMFEMKKLMGMYSCEINYDYSIQVYVCECN